MTQEEPKSQTSMPLEDRQKGVTTVNGVTEIPRGIPEEGSFPTPDDYWSLAATEYLARWLIAQIQLPGFVADEDWTPEHTKEFAKFCHSKERQRWFLWMSRRPRPPLPRGSEEDGSITERWGLSRLMFSDELPVHCAGPMLQHGGVQQESASALVFVSKRDASKVKREAPEEQLLCVSFHGGVLEGVIAFIRGVYIPVLGQNHAWPQSFKKEVMKRVR